MWWSGEFPRRISSLVIIKMLRLLCEQRMRDQDKLQNVTLSQTVTDPSSGLNNGGKKVRVLKEKMNKPPPPGLERQKISELLSQRKTEPLTETSDDSEGRTRGGLPPPRCYGIVPVTFVCFHYKLSLVPAPF